MGNTPSGSSSEAGDDIDEIIDGLDKIVDEIDEAIDDLKTNDISIGEVLKGVCKEAFIPTNIAHHRKLTPEEASCPCTAYTPKELLDTLNLFTGKTHNMDRELLEETFAAACDGSKICDFGTIYSWYRLEATGSFRGTDLWISLYDPRDIHDAADEDMSIETVTDDDGNEYILHPPSVDPLRLWDLYSHRVIPFRWFRKSDFSITNIVRAKEYANYWAISHSWTDDMVRLTTAVNQEQHPVPIPEGITLEAVRDELLGLGAQFCWLDLLCLRQSYLNYNGDPWPGWENKTVYGRSWLELEEMRDKEWKTDVPMMGQIYEKSKQTVRWYNGLGREFTTKGWGHRRHWCNRVWTLQENSGWEDFALTGGHPGGELDLQTMCENGDEWRSAEDLLGPSADPAPPRMFMKNVLKVLEGLNWDVFLGYFKEINLRGCSNPVDRVNGLNFLLYQPRIPVYREMDTVEQAWSRSWISLREHIKSSIREELKLGVGEQPTWKQLLDHTGITPRE